MTAFGLQIDIARPGFSFHKLDKAKDKSFWSLGVNSDIRIIVHRSEKSIFLSYVGHHDKACGWAERRRIDVYNGPDILDRSSRTFWIASRGSSSGFKICARFRSHAILLGPLVRFLAVVRYVGSNLYQKAPRKPQRAPDTLLNYSLIALRGAL
jgi:hypothetical protein